MVRFLITTVLLWTVLFVQARADTFYVESTEVVGSVTPERRETVQGLIQSSIAGEGGHEVTGSDQNADFTLQPKVLREGDRYTVVLEKYTQGNVVWAGRTQPVVSQNLNQNVSRLVRQMLAGARDDADQFIDVTVYTEGAAPKREATPAADAPTDTSDKTIPLKRFYFGFGPVFMPDVIDGTSDPQLGLHAAYNWDLDYALLNLFGDFAFNGSEPGLAGGGIGVNYLALPDRETTPFLGAELGYAAAFPDEGDAVGGFIINGVVGGQFFRSSIVNLEISFSFGVFTSAIQGETPLVSAIRVGIYFG